MEKFYAVINGLKHGPFTFDELKAENISKKTLIWTEEMTDWIEAKDVPQLNEIIKIIPPPIPLLPDKPIQVKAYIGKNHNPLEKSLVKIKIAKEIMINFKLIKYALFIGLILFPVIFSMNSGFSNMILAYELNRFDDDNYLDFSPSGRQQRDIKNAELSNRSYWLGNGFSTDRNSFNKRYDISIDYHINKTWQIAGKSALLSLLSIFIISLMIIIGRYSLFGLRWVRTTSRKEIGLHNDN
jgi:hypothetical protein